MCGSLSGGEPTFVSIDNQVDPEWTTDADGEHKRERASVLAARLKAVWAPRRADPAQPGQVVPGEPLPRWQIGLFWRTDGQPLWNDAALLADPWGGEVPALADDAGQRILAAVAADFGLPARQVRPAYEDALSRLAAAVRQPAGEPVAAADDLAEDTPGARAELLARLDTSIDQPTAYVLPLHRRADGSGWASADWQLRRGRIVLTEGDSPAGLRLPLDAISWHPPRPSYDADPLSRGTGVRAEPDEAELEPADDAPIDGAGRRDPFGVPLRLPAPDRGARRFRRPRRPVSNRAAAKLDTPVVIEGYGPPPDARIASMSITPDPGVIEVNVAPTASFAEQSAQLETLYEQARQARLSRPNRSTWTVRTAVPAAATTSRSAASLRPTHRSCAGPTCWCRCSPIGNATLRCPTCSPAGSSAPRRRLRGWTRAGRGALRAGDRARRDRAASADAARGTVAALSLGHRQGTAPSAHRYHRQHSPRRILHRQALQPRQCTRAPGAVGVAGFRDAAALPDGDGAVAACARTGRQVLGRAVTGSVDPARRQSSWQVPVAALPDSGHRRRSRPTCGRTASTSTPAGWIRSPSSASRGWAPRSVTAWRSSFAARSNRGMCWGRSRPPGAPPATWTRRWSGSRCGWLGADRHRYIVTANGYPIPLLATDNPDVQVGGVRFRAWQPPSALHPTITVDSPLRFELVDSSTGQSKGWLHVPRGAPGWAVLRHSAGQRGRGRVAAWPSIRQRRDSPRASSTCRT